MARFSDEAKARLAWATARYDDARGGWWKALLDAQDEGATIDDLVDELGMSLTELDQEFTKIAEARETCERFAEVA